MCVLANGAQWYVPGMENENSGISGNTDGIKYDRPGNEKHTPPQLNTPQCSGPILIREIGSWRMHFPSEWTRFAHANFNLLSIQL